MRYHRVRDWIGIRPQCSGRINGCRDLRSRGRMYHGGSLSLYWSRIYVERRCDRSDEEEVRKSYGMEGNNTKSQVGGFQAMTQDALTVLNDIPFSIPPVSAVDSYCSWKSWE